MTTKENYNGNNLILAILLGLITLIIMTSCGSRKVNKSQTKVEVMFQSFRSCNESFSLFIAKFLTKLLSVFTSGFQTLKLSDKIQFLSKSGIFTLKKTHSSLSNI